ncbi:hypothetical protein MT_57070 [Pseudomonas phage phiPto-bp6g]|nr:hypothetical protein MT_57070 [Pseudomonas phage phiPto-bp6g]
MLTIKEVIQLALSDYDKYSFMCNRVEELNINTKDIIKTLDFIESQLGGKFTLTDFLMTNFQEYASLCDSHDDGYESDKPFAYRVNWWNEVIKLPEAQV